MKQPPRSARELLADHGLPEDVIKEVLDTHAHELAERIRNVHGSGEGDSWNWWDAADIPAACADLIDPNKTP
jgi:hypothetical protein